MLFMPLNPPPSKHIHTRTSPYHVKGGGGTSSSRKVSCGPFSPTNNAGDIEAMGNRMEEGAKLKFEFSEKGSCTVLLGLWKKKKITNSIF